MLLLEVSLDRWTSPQRHLLLPGDLQMRVEARQEHNHNSFIEKSTGKSQLFHFFFSFFMFLHPGQL